jgi:hypothetical protein
MKEGDLLQLFVSAGRAVSIMIPWGTKRVRNSENSAGSQKRPEQNVIRFAGILKVRTPVYRKGY